MQGMIFAAGLGTRLYPITKDIPKALVKVGEKTLLEHIINKMIAYNIKHIVVNVHHFADKVIDFLHSKQWDCDILVSDERDFLLDTGGGLLKAYKDKLFLDDEDILIHNVDILSDENFSDICDYHKINKNIATLCVKNRTTSRYLLFNENNILCGRRNIKLKEETITRPYKQITPYAFSGIHLFSPTLLNSITLEGKFSIIEAYLELSKTFDLKAYINNQSKWLDVGKTESLSQAESLFK